MNFIDEEYLNEKMYKFYQKLENGGVEAYKSNILSLDELRACYEKRSKEWGFHIIYDVELHKDESTGLYYTNHDFRYCDDKLCNHLVAEELYAVRKQVDWKRVTNCYEYRIVDKINHLISNPLVWIPTEEIKHICLVDGKVAIEAYQPDDYNSEGRYDALRPLTLKGLLWFADILPVSTDVDYSIWDESLPPDMILWDRLLQNSFQDFYPNHLRYKLELIVQARGGARAAEIVERFREDWPDIIKLKLFGIDRMEDYQVENLRKALFDELDRYIKIWKADSAQDTGKTLDDTSLQQTEELFHFIHPSVIDEDEKRKVHLEVKNLVKNYPIPEIFNHLSKMADDNRIYYRTLNHAIVRAELERLGLPDENQPNYTAKTFDKHFH
ncbi:MAG: hypothetical protein IK073_05335 [Paludibacteraceae bacterium]|nr:hypothetical protein [Paludibacteraceae bacterium]